MYHVYILRSIKNGRFYTGSTDNIERRFHEHNSGHSKATKSGVPFEIIYTESYNTRTEAYNREMYFKTGVGREELKYILSSRKQLEGH